MVSGNSREMVRCADSGVGTGRQLPLRPARRHPMRVCRRRLRVCRRRRLAALTLDTSTAIECTPAPEQFRLTAAGMLVADAAHPGANPKGNALT